MISKTDWNQHIHSIRKREIDLVFSLSHRKHFISGLEVGAGDGYQTKLLAPNLDTLISSDLNFKRIKEKLNDPKISYLQLDADSLEGVFTNDNFDFIFSSNVLEHLHDPFKFLVATWPLLQPDGQAVHIVPNRWIKISYLFFHYSNLLLLIIDRLWGKFNGQDFFRGSSINVENNINLKDKSLQTRSWFKKFILPPVHGNFPSHWQEFKSFGRASWENLFKKAGYLVVSYSPGPVFSGYGFGFERLRKFLEYFKISSEHIFILKKMTDFERLARDYTENFLLNGSIYEKEKFISDWLNKKKKADLFLIDFKKEIGDPQGKSVLDVGFGNGIILAEFSRAGAFSFGLETEEKLFDLATKYFRDKDLVADLKVYDGKNFPFPDNTFDYVYSTSVLEHMSYPQDVLSEISRTLVPGGKFYLSFPNRYALKESHTGIWFISWLPYRLASCFLRCFNRNSLEDWNLHFISFFTLKRMVKISGLKIVYNTESRSWIKRLIKKFLAYWGIHYGILLKTIIIVLEKNKHG